VLIRQTLLIPAIGLRCPDRMVPEVSGRDGDRSWLVVDRRPSDNGRIGIALVSFLGAAEPVVRRFGFLMKDAAPAPARQTFAPPVLMTATSHDAI